MLARLRIAFVLSAALVTAFADDAQAFCRSTTCTGDCPRDADECKTSGEKLYWAGGCVGFSLQKDGSVNIPLKYVGEVTRRSFLAWTELECGAGLTTLSFSELPEVTCHETEYNSGGTNANIILFQDYKWKYSSVDNTLAKTTVTFDDSTGEILDADIEINHAYNNFTINDEVVDYDLESVMTHEIGHFIGIDHTPDFTATMYAGYEPGTIEQRTLEPDDVLAACDAYPPTRQVTCNPEPRGGQGDVCGGEPTETGDSGDGCSSAAGATGTRGGLMGARMGASAMGALLGLALILSRRRLGIGA